MLQGLCHSTHTMGIEEAEPHGTALYINQQVKTDMVLVEGEEVSLRCLKHSDVNSPLKQGHQETNVRREVLLWDVCTRSSFSFSFPFSSLFQHPLDANHRLYTHSVGRPNFIFSFAPVYLFTLI